MGSEKENGRLNQGNTTIILVIVVVILLVVAVYLFLNYSSRRSETIPQQQTESRIGTEITQPAEEGELLPEKDAVGTKDLVIIDRYPGSIRTMYENISDIGYESVTYVTKDLPDDVKEYYYNRLQEDGWELVSSAENELRFEKEPATLGLHLYYDEQGKILKYTLEYSPGSD